MWYLVVPPIVVVLSLSFLVWYLSKKEEDPVIAEKIIQGAQAEKKMSFPRTKEFFLKMLEKSGQRFKVMSLRTHNAVHEFTQSVKASRAKVHTALESTQKKKEEGVDQTSPAEHQEEPPYVFARPKESVPLTSDILEVPIIRRRKEEVVETPPVEKIEVVPRPMVSEIAVHPEKKKPLRPNAAREEHLIARIAKDPKDFTAYEELGDYYFGMENIKDAKECYRQVLKLSPVHRMVKIKIRRLEKLLTRAGE